jgi:hypothetical protein
MKSEQPVQRDTANGDMLRPSQQVPQPVLGCSAFGMIEFDMA